MFYPRVAMTLFICCILLSPLDAQETKPMTVLKPEQIFALVERLTENVHYTVADLEHILGPLDLRSKPDLFNDYFDFYKAQCDDSQWLKSVELRAPVPGRPSTKRLLILDLKEGVGREIGYEEIVLHYGEEDEFEIPYPEAPPEVPLGFIYSRSWGKIYFGITRDFEEFWLASPYMSTDGRIPPGYRPVF